MKEGVLLCCRVLVSQCDIISCLEDPSAAEIRSERRSTSESSLQESRLRVGCDLCLSLSGPEHMSCTLKYWFYFTVSAFVFTVVRVQFSLN